MAEVIYDNFINDYDKEKVFLSDFKYRFIDAIQAVSLSKSEDVRKTVSNIIREVKSSKLL